MTSALSRISRTPAAARVVSIIVRTSLPAISGAAIMAQRLKCARYSVWVMPPLPTSSMSGSFQPPGRATCQYCDDRSTIDSTLLHRSAMSPVVRHRLPTAGAHVHGSLRPHSQMLNTIARPLAASASRKIVYRVRASRPSVLHQSILT